MLTGINKKMPFIYSLTGVLLVVLAGYILYSGIQRNASAGRKQVREHATLVAAAIDIEQLDRLTESSAGNQDAYRELSRVLDNLVAVSPEITAIAVALQEQDAFSVLVGGTHRFEGTLPLGGQAITLVESNDSEGTSLVTAYVPLKSNAGQYLAAVDMYQPSVFGGFRAIGLPILLIVGASVMITMCLLSRNYQNRVKEFVQQWIESEYQLQNEELAEKEDELLLLRKTFTRMKEDLHKATTEKERLEKELENPGEGLDQRVVARTRELLETIRDLHVELEERRIIEKKRLEDIKELKDKMAKIRTLSGLLPICASCKKIRDEHGHWNELEAYIEAHSDIVFSHGICPECIEKLYPVKQPVKSPMRGVPYLR